MANKDQIKGKGEVLKGKVEHGVGKAVGNERMQVRGKVTEMKGKARSTVGGAKDTAHHLVEDTKKSVRDNA